MADEGAEHRTAPDAQPTIPQEAGQRAAQRGLLQLGHKFAARHQLSAAVGMLTRAGSGETDLAGRVPAEPNFTLPGRPEVFAIGDIVSLNKVPGRGRSARAGGACDGKVIEAREDRGRASNFLRAIFRQRRDGQAHQGMGPTVFDGVATKFTRFMGFLVWAFMRSVFRHLISWDSRLGTLYTWACGIWFQGHPSPFIHHLRFGEEGGEQAFPVGPVDPGSCPSPRAAPRLRPSGRRLKGLLRREGVRRTHPLLRRRRVAPRCATPSPPWGAPASGVAVSTTSS